MYAGSYTFTYVAVDDFKNKAKCNFTISIFDNKPPNFENCVKNQTFYVSSKNNTGEMIEWEEPFFYDNVDDKNITISSNLKHGFYDPGEYFVNYTATDKSGNSNTCLISVNVKERKCDELEKPENGLRACAKNFTTTWCDFRCDFGYGITDNDSVIENVVYHCNNIERIWSQNVIPECSLIEQPNSVEEVLTISLDSENLGCEDFTNNVSLRIEMKSLLLLNFLFSKNSLLMTSKKNYVATKNAI
jgi:sushi, von Willebrand factor type A, EGF and pentraxin domain-containing protein 1